MNMKTLAWPRLRGLCTEKSLIRPQISRQRTLTLHFPTNVGSGPEKPLQGLRNAANEPKKM
jgi:hypothetical protein